MIYIQSNSDRTIPHHFDCSCALYGTIDNCLDWRLTSYEEIESGKFDSLIRSNLFVGSVEFMREVFNRVGKNPKLPKINNREYFITDLKTIKEKREKNEIYFIKPVENKLFTGFIFDKMNYSFINKLSDDTQIIAFEPFKNKILSEWRLYIFRNEIVDSRNYSGDFKLNIDYTYAENLIKENKDFPVSYTIDLGLLSNNETVLIEYNDMWAIGNYGIDNSLYFKLLKNRYFEIIRN